MGVLLILGFVKCLGCFLLVCLCVCRLYCFFMCFCYVL